MNYIFIIFIFLIISILFYLIILSSSKLLQLLIIVFFSLFLQNICFDHPPNKSIFIYKHGLSIVITTLRHHSLNIDVNKQGLSLLFYILTDSIQSKFHLIDARKGALSLGIITVIEAAQINFKGESTIQDPCNYLLQILATEFD